MVVLGLTVNLAFGLLAAAFIGVLIWANDRATSPSVD